jgi:hypothetical protein
LTLLACGDDTTTTANDLSALADLSGFKPDRVPLLTCAQTETCASMCTMANLNTCIPACIAQLDPAAQSYFNALSNCAGPACTVVDGGAGPCSNPGSQACQTCVTTNCGSQLSACLAH